MYGIGNVPEFADQTPITIEEARKKASLRTEQIRSKWKIKHDSHHPKYVFKVGDLVIRKIAFNDPRLIKTSPKYEGPFVIQKQWLPVKNIRRKGADYIAEELEMRSFAKARFKRDHTDFVRRFVTMDETWVHHYTPETKQHLLHGMGGVIAPLVNHISEFLVGLHGYRSGSALLHGQDTITKQQSKLLI
ncbi:hypothetical protein LAZ67_6002609 [Cordylochernes scorpioides]|uniref:Uncharacterized protein n=1 Tax=Cordylochernes scorpioides TaxID=51811 RepID=A0ABY6KKZ8_9ARAC|nr:hypothetical protein LAZ67_6002609 [Cordylochernes scorpioides]